MSLKQTLTAIALAAAFAACLPAHAAMPSAAKGPHAKVPCSMCHANGQMTAPKKETCFQCHQSYAAVAKKTQKVNPNPHFNHRGEQECTNCHKMHTKSRVECNDCHTFNNLKMKGE